MANSAHRAQLSITDDWSHLMILILDEAINVFWNLSEVKIATASQEVEHVVPSIHILIYSALGVQILFSDPTATPQEILSFLCHISASF